MDYIYILYLLTFTDVSVNENSDLGLPVSSPVDSSDLECSLCMRYHFIPLGNLQATQPICDSI